MFRLPALSGVGVAGQRCSPHASLFAAAAPGHGVTPATPRRALGGTPAPRHPAGAPGTATPGSRRPARPPLSGNSAEQPAAPSPSCGAHAPHSPLRTARSARPPRTAAGTASAGPVSAPPGQGPPAAAPAHLRGRLSAAAPPDGSERRCPRPSSSSARPLGSRPRAPPCQGRGHPAPPLPQPARCSPRSAPPSLPAPPAPAPPRPVPLPLGRRGHLGRSSAGRRETGGVLDAAPGFVPAPGPRSVRAAAPCGSRRGPAGGGRAPGPARPGPHRAPKLGRAPTGGEPLLPRGWHGPH